GVTFRLEWITRRRDIPVNRVKLEDHRFAIESGLCQGPAKFFAARKQMMRRSGWKIHFQIGMLSNRIVDHLCIRILLQRCPDGKSEFSAGFQDATCLSASALGIRNMEQRKTGQDTVERCVNK